MYNYIAVNHKHIIIFTFSIICNIETKYACMQWLLTLKCSVWSLHCYIAFRPGFKQSTFYIFICILLPEKRHLWSFLTHIMKYHCLDYCLSNLVKGWLPSNNKIASTKPVPENVQWHTYETVFYKSTKVQIIDVRKSDYFLFFSGKIQQLNLEFSMFLN